MIGDHSFVCVHSNHLHTWQIWYPNGPTDHVTNNMTFYHLNTGIVKVRYSFDTEMSGFRGQFHNMFCALHQSFTPKFYANKSFSKVGSRALTVRRKAPTSLWNCHLVFNWQSTWFMTSRQTVPDTSSMLGW